MKELNRSNALLPSNVERVRQIHHGKAACSARAGALAVVHVERESSPETDCSRNKRPSFIDDDVWKRAHYYSSTRKAVEHLKLSFDRHTGLDELADIAAMERTTFSKTFRQRTGMALHRFVQAYRVSHAVLKMEMSDYSITEIAFSTGFVSLDTFARTFKNITGSTPSKYRLALRIRNRLTVTTHAEPVEQSVDSTTVMCHGKR
jgi:AraC-like DNA-binding protein